MTWTPSPAAETFGAIQKAVAGYVLMPTDSEVIDCAGQGLRRGIDRINSRNWNWLLAYDDITFVEGQYDYTLSRWFKAARNFELWDSNSVSRDRLGYVPWKTLITENPDATVNAGTPCRYSVSNINATGLVTLDVAPSSGWVSTYPMGRIQFFRKVQYPVDAGTALDVPSEVVLFLQSWAEGYTADRYAVTKARDAYARAERILHELVVDDCHGQTADWE